MKDPRTAFRPNHSNGVRRTLIKRSLAAGALFFTLSSTSLPLWAAAGRTKRAAPRIVVLYFSATGTTKRAAETIARMTGAPIWRIEPEVPYPDKMRAVADKVKADEKAGIRVRPKAPLPEALRNADIYIIGSPSGAARCPPCSRTFCAAKALPGSASCRSRRTWEAILATFRKRWRLPARKRKSPPVSRSVRPLTTRFVRKSPFGSSKRTLDLNERSNNRPRSSAFPLFPIASRGIPSCRSPVVHS